MKILLLDNFDSFTYNLVHLIEKAGFSHTEVIQTNRLSLDFVANYDKIILSPGPGLPRDHGVLVEVIQKFSTTKSILGVCLGHQAIAEAFGGALLNLQSVFHGLATSTRALTEDVLFRSIPSSFQTGRYHSWIVDGKKLPPCLEVIARDDEGAIMAFRHKNYDVRGVQFHPESILTEYGEEMMRNWLGQPVVSGR